MPAGKLVVFEGIEGSGKSTQAKLFHEELLRRGEKSILTAEPTQHATGKLIRELLKSESKVDIRTLQLLFVANRSEHVETFIKPKLEEGYTVVSDRYSPSTIAYGAAFGRELGLRVSYLIDVHAPFVPPDLILLIGVTPKRAMERIRARKGQWERFDDVASLKALEASYVKVAKGYYPSRWRVIDGNGSVDEVKSDVVKAWKEFEKGR
ncbi:MAG: dTMP kinase [Candidatus Micrarchaeota archaeon]|nr:dTMP kinase [Candidatus Micrarchaeota archaeon]